MLIFLRSDILVIFGGVIVDLMISGEMTVDLNICGELTIDLMIFWWMIVYNMALYVIFGNFRPRVAFALPGQDGRVD